ncbi:MAG: N-acetylglucosamine-6-phosphate deacetylase [Eubacteriales bacterium]
MIIQNAEVFQPNGTFIKQDLAITDDRITVSAKDSTILDGSNLVAIPGLVDIHFHGCVGYDFCDGSHEAFRAISNYQLSQGTMAICPATMTFGEEKLVSICEQAASFSNPEGADLVGINLEGPFISSEKKGAQNGAYISNPSLQMFRHLVEASKGLVKLVDIAPETEGAMEFIQEARSSATVSLAHTGADFDIATEAFQNGATHVTHLYNAMQPYNHRAPGLIGAACDQEHVRVELIADGIHIHPAAIRTTFKMFGDNRICLISDSMEATGLKDGDYSLGGQPVKVVGNLATLSNGTIAGSATNLYNCMKTAVLDMNIPLGSAVKCATINPAQAIGVDKDYGTLEVGKYANVILLDKDTMTIKHLLFKGVLL